MISKILGMFFLTAFVSGTQALACSCMGFSNPQQAAQGNAIVAKVSTKTVDMNSGLGTVVIEKIYKGSITATEIEVQGQDGANCASEILEPAAKSWVAIFNQDENGSYYMAGCANATLPIDASGKVQTYFSEAIAVTEQELIDLVNLKAIPTVQGLACESNVTRTYISNDGSKGLSDISFYESLVIDPANPLDLIFEKDFSAEGLQNTYKVYAWASASYWNAFEYTFSATVTEPFYGVSTNQTTTLNIVKNSMADSIQLSTYKDVNGVTKDDYAGAPFYAYDAGIQCSLKLVAPIIAVK